ncbi:hypothetical protein [Mycobacterium sp. DL99]|uniref:hypothetical protein n=1 Tax=Mycobacterium sp. DL99 TaxID=2528957 RepID=UPI0010812842|nr:hypothetical protein [Mycobacterium sp. DL99]
MTTVIEGEVVTSRRIERNAARTPEVLPPDVDTKVVAISRLDTPEMQTRAVTTMLNHARTGLLAAIAAQDLPEIVKFKQKATAIHDIAKQVRLGKDIQLDAAEFVRRAERGLGVAIREGQARGEVETTAEGKARGSATRDQVVTYEKVKPKPTDFAGVHELTNTHGGIYDLTDNVSDEQFEEVITEAKAEGNLSRANVARKAKAKAQSKEPINADDPLIDAEVEPAPTPEPALPRPFKKSDTEMLAEIVGSLANFADLMRYIRADQINKSDAIRLADQAGSAIGLIRKSLKGIRNGNA